MEGASAAMAADSRIMLPLPDSHHQKWVPFTLPLSPLYSVYVIGRH